MRISWSRGWWAADPAALAGGWVMAMGQLSSSSGCWGSNVTKGHRKETGKRDSQVGPESEFRLMAMCIATGEDKDLRLGIS